MSGRVGLVTGSEPFAGLPSNPAEMLLRDLDGRTFMGFEVRAVATPVDYERLQVLLPELIDEYDPAFVVSLGLANGSPVVSVEQIAINAADFAIPDNVGAKPQGEPHTADGCEALLATWDAKEIAAALREDGIPAQTSWYAGTHLCNMTLFVMLHSLAARGKLQVPCGFLHLPYLPEQVIWLMEEAGRRNADALSASPAQPSMNYPMQKRATEIMLHLVAEGASTTVSV